MKEINLSKEDLTKLNGIRDQVGKAIEDLKYTRSGTVEAFHHIGILTKNHEGEYEAVIETKTGAFDLKDEKIINTLLIPINPISGENKGNTLVLVKLEKEDTPSSYESYKAEFVVLNNVHNNPKDGKATWTSFFEYCQGGLMIMTESRNVALSINNDDRRLKPVRDIEADYAKYPNSYKKLEEFLNILTTSNTKPVIAELPQIREIK